MLRCAGLATFLFREKSVCNPDHLAAERSQNDVQVLQAARQRMAPSGIQSQRLCSGGQLRGSWGLGHWGLRLTGPGSYPWLRSWLSSELAWRPRMLRVGPLCIWLPAAATAPWCSSSLRLARTSTAMMVLEVLPPKQLPCLNNPLSFLCATAALPSTQIETSCEPAVCGYRETWNVIAACQISWQEADFS